MIGQPKHVEVEFVPAGSAEARRLFPELQADPVIELTVISDEGDVYTGDGAWIMCLYALVEYRDWSFRLASGPLRPLARRVWDLISTNRGSLSDLLALPSDACQR
jgi:hypothetical protein